ncbi:MAG: endonuclease/exonuclease/phosphatase family protein [Bacteroides sp.]|nr:endonuclease/exonuclease/phosphatase family protein [Bacteroides sp.]
MKKLLITVCLLLLPVVLTVAQRKPYKVVFYNVENLFDTVDDPDTHDEEFTPQGPKAWTQEKYQKKLGNIERVLFDIAAINKDYPVVIGLSEIENRNVLEDLVVMKKMAPADYRIIHHDSPDARGVDVAFFYRPDVFKLEGEKAFKTSITSVENFRTRDILTMWGKIEGEDFLFMVAHWPSRLGGKEASEDKRMAAATQMRQIADSVLQERPQTKVVMMGDFNDDPTDKSIAQCLNAKRKVKDLRPGDLFSPYTDMLRAGYGTLAYSDAWNIFDNIVVSENLVNARKGCLKLKKADGSKFYGNIFKQHYMVQKEGQYKGYPLRTFVGNTFQGGYSDHFPVYIYIGK